MFIKVPLSAPDQRPEVSAPPAPHRQGVDGRQRPRPPLHHRRPRRDLQESPQGQSQRPSPARPRPRIAQGQVPTAIPPALAQIPINDAHHWRRDSEARCWTDAESRPPAHVPVVSIVRNAQMAHPCELEGSCRLQLPPSASLRSSTRSPNPKRTVLRSGKY